MLFRENIKDFCETNGLENLFERIVKVFLEEVGEHEENIYPHHDIDDLLYWDGTRQGYVFWEYVYYNMKLNYKVKRWFTRELNKYCPMPDVEVFKYEDS